MPGFSFSDVNSPKKMEKNSSGRIWRTPACNTAPSYQEEDLDARETEYRGLGLPCAWYVLGYEGGSLIRTFSEGEGPSFSFLPSFCIIFPLLLSRLPSRSWNGVQVRNLPSIAAAFVLESSLFTTKKVLEEYLNLLRSCFSAPPLAPPPLVQRVFLEGGKEKAADFLLISQQGDAAPVH